jgi:hypothetical protein
MGVYPTEEILRQETIQKSNDKSFLVKLSYLDEEKIIFRFLYVIFLQKEW